MNLSLSKEFNNLVEYDMNTFIENFIKKCNTCSSTEDLDSICEYNKIYNVQLSPIVVISSINDDIYYSLKIRYLYIFISTEYLIKPTTSKKEFDNLLLFFINKSKMNLNYLKEEIEDSYKYSFKLIHEDYYVGDSDKLVPSTYIAKDKSFTIIKDIRFIANMDYYNLIIDKPFAETKEKSILDKIDFKSKIAFMSKFIK